MPNRDGGHAPHGHSLVETSIYRKLMDGDLSLDAVQAALRTTTIGRHICYEYGISSTLDRARQAVAAGAPEGTLVIAEAQAAGRGRLGRMWVSQPGLNLHTTLVLYPTTLRQLKHLPMVTALAALQAVETITSLRPVIKWPNDGLLNGRKFLGILIESALEGTDVRFALAGAGLNVNGDFAHDAELHARATSLRVELGHPVSRELVLAAFLNEFEALYQSPEPDVSIHAPWRARLDTLGKRVTVVLASGQETQEGLAEDVTATGGLVLRRSDGSHIVVDAGDVTLRPGGS